MRTLGIDYGTVRIGVAVSDVMGIISTPKDTLHPRGINHAAELVAACAADLEAELIVVGMPYHLSGRKGELADQVDRFNEKLGHLTSIEIKTWDERLTSKQAERVLIEGGARRSKRKQVIDKLAAQIMLQSYLDAQAF